MAARCGDRIQSEYVVADSGIEMLAQACAGADRAAQLHDEIAVIRVRGAVRAHPAVKDLNKGISNCLTGRTLGSPGGVATRFGSVGRLAAACR
jgi:hypothetical protein